MLAQSTDDAFTDLIIASESSMVFWNHPLDDEWDNA